MRRSGFRDDIQGMRALAVLAILLYHAGYSPYPGGFVTLDVFFVVSGFLITFLLLREIRRDATISLVGFYARRARRILPAATFVTLVTVAASWHFLNVVDARHAAYDGLWAAFFGANVRFAMEDTDYFAQDVPPSPLQHYWSLAVEEQFYLVLPLVLVLCLLWVRRRRAGVRSGVRAAERSPLPAIAALLGVMTLASFAWSLHASSASPDTAYFSTFTRAWEFGVGALLAMAAPLFAGGLPAWARNALAGAGLAAIVAACFLITEETPFPGWAALLPVLGTGAVMVAGAEHRGTPPLAQRLLGMRPLRAVGDASYSLYLWHWPVLAIASQHLGRDLTGRETLVAVAFIAVLTWASYRWIETPFRTLSPTPLSRALTLYPASVAVVLVGCLASVSVLDRSFDDDAPAISVSTYSTAPSGEELSDDSAVALVQASVAAALDEAPVPGSLEPPVLELRKDRADVGECDYREEPWTLCVRGDADAERTLVLLGNSHGRHWIPALDPIAQDAGYRAYYLVRPGCSPVRVAHGTLDGEEVTGCTRFNEWATEQVAELAPDLLIVTGTPPARAIIDGELVRDEDTLREATRTGFADLLDEVSPHAGRTVLLGDTPKRTDSPVDCLGRTGAHLGDCLGEPLEHPRLVALDSRRTARARGIDFIDTHRWFCTDEGCPAVVGSHVVMRDPEHVTTVYAAQLADALADALELSPASANGR
ncbi:acyltransferase family protein [Nocardioides ochotonae]|uniref:acyltransferase family protein n=1 Tax=Nocardioides ochotonae TaxID=2685869 RepID=UPI00140AF804